MSTMSWQEYAACADADPEVFFPVGEPGSRMYAREVAVAKGYCARCPVREVCLADAVEGELSVGVFGGTTPEERRPMQRASAFETTGKVGAVRVNIPDPNARWGAATERRDRARTR